METDGTFTTRGGVKLSAWVVKQELARLQCYAIPKERLKVHGKAFASGGFGFVKLATLLTTRDSQCDEINVVVKELRVDTTQVIPLRAAYRLVRETLVWSTCKHENILEFLGYHIGEAFDPAYLISPHMKNGNMKNYLARNEVDTPKLLGLVRDTLNGMIYLHSRDPPIIHGDLKAANVLLSDSHRALLCDFGLATIMQDFPTGNTTSSDFRGSIRWCSPEILSDNQRTLMSDIWAWACLVLEMMTRKTPYHEIKNENFIPVVMVRDSKTPEPSVDPILPLGILNMLRECWNFNPGRRPVASACMAVLDTATEALTSALAGEEREEETPVDQFSSILPALDRPLERQQPIPPQVEPLNLNRSSSGLADASAALGTGPTAKTEQRNPSLLESKIMTKLGEVVNQGNPREIYSLIRRIRQGPPRNYYIAKSHTGWSKATIHQIDLAHEPPNELIVNEILMMKKTQHPNIVRFVGAYLAQSAELWLVMEPTEGGDLKQVIENNTLEEDQISSIFLQTCRGLRYLHLQYIVHRDIRAQNILLDALGHVKLIGFEHSTTLQAANPLYGDTKAGSVFWMAPEVVNGEKCNTKVDIWSLGIMGFEMIEKRPPYYEDGQSNAIYFIAMFGTPTLKNPEKLSGELKRFLSACLSVHVASRPSAGNLIFHEFLRNACNSSDLLPLLQLRNT